MTNTLLMAALNDAVGAEYRLGQQVQSLCTKLGHDVPVGFTGTARIMLVGDDDGEGMVAELDVNDSDDGDDDETYPVYFSLPQDDHLFELLANAPSFRLGNEPAQYQKLVDHINAVTDQLAVIEKGVL